MAHLGTRFCNLLIAVDTECSSCMILSTKLCLDMVLKELASSFDSLLVIMIQAYCLITGSEETFISHNYEYPENGQKSVCWVISDINLTFHRDGCLDLKLMAIQTSFQLSPLSHHMTFDATPALSVGSDSNGSGVVALLWLRSFDQHLRESIDYAIRLNSLGSGENGLWLHVSKPPENAYVKQILRGK
ncbi:hypothetical protein CTI12_AA427440 [Artemisia annua]|uniref:Uncharacterized protein n=1 Tax=Artemisia annua TaxID=35608 RepID=A0A2U1LSW4_ARTAN|nr:hypothetical protein CTI12_AA427440 [Artemisia annua]